MNVKKHDVMKRTITAICTALIIGASAANAQQFSLWLTTDGAGIQLNSGTPYGPPPPPPHHHYGRPEYRGDARHYRHVSKKMHKKYKKMRKAQREYQKARHDFYKHTGRHHHHH